MPTFYVKVDWEAGWPGAALLHINIALGPHWALAHASEIQGSRQKGRCRLSMLQLIEKHDGQSIPYRNFNVALGPH